MPMTDKRRILPAICIGACTFYALAGARLAHAQQAGANYGPYVSIAGGVSFPDDMSMTLRNPAGGPPQSRDVNFNTGFNINGAIGEKWTNGFRTELELGYRHADISRFDAVSWTGSQKVLGLMGNVLYDIDTHGGLTFSVGGGAGVGHNKWDNVAPAAGGGPVFDSHDTNFQWQAIGEVSVPVSTRLAAFADYRYITLYDNAFTSPSGARISAGTDHSNNILVGLRFFFSPRA